MRERIFSGFFVLIFLVWSSCKSPDTAERRALVVYNSNYLYGRTLALFYASMRNIPTEYVCGLSLPLSMFATRDNLLGARREAIRNCVCPLIREDVRPNPCDETNLLAIQAVRPITHVVYLKGIPMRLYETGWINPGAPASPDQEMPSFDYYFANTLFDEKAVCTSTDPTVCSATGPYIFDIGSQGYLTLRSRYPAYPYYGQAFTYVPPLDDSYPKDVAFGRLEAADANTTMSLIARTKIAEENGLDGNFAATMGTWFNANYFPPAMAFLAELTGGVTSNCTAQFRNEVAWDPGQCPVVVTPSGKLPGLDPSVVAVPNATFFLGANLPNHNQMGFNGSVNALTAYRKTSELCTPFCKDVTPENGETQAEAVQACRMASSDYYKEINTACVGVNSGFLGHQTRSYAVQYYGVLPPVWLTYEAGSQAKTPLSLSLTGGYQDSRFTDERYVSLFPCSHRDIGQRKSALSITLQDPLSKCGGAEWIAQF